MVKRFFSGFTTESEKSSSLKGYYQSVADLPLHNWIKCTDGDLTYCRIEGKGDKERDSQAWEMINDDYIKRNGLGKLKKKMLETMVKKANAELDFVITGERFKLTEIEIQEAKLEAMLKNAGNGMTINQTLIHLSKWIGHWLNDKDLKTQEYFDLLREYEKYNKPHKEAIKDRQRDGKKNK